MNVREVFTADKKRGERGNASKVVNQARTGTNFESSKKDGTCGRGVDEKEESLTLLLTFKELKWNVFTITAYKDGIFMRRFLQSATNRYQSISIYLLIVIENRYQSITTRIFAIDWSSIININRLIDIDWYWLISIVIDSRFHRLDTPGHIYNHLFLEIWDPKTGSNRFKPVQTVLAWEPGSLF